MSDSRPPKTERPANRKVSNGVVALSSAAVLTVYSAGYVRTRAAAERLEAYSQRPPYLAGRGAAPTEDVVSDPGRGSADVSATQPATAADTLTTAMNPAPAAPSVGAAVSTPAAPASVPVSSTVAAVSEPSAVENGSHKVETADAVASLATPAAPAVAPSAPVVAPAPVATVAKVETPAAAVLPAAPLPAAPAAAASAQQTERAPITPAPAPAPIPAAPKGPAWAGPWKDGRYLGWGYSRHGDIQAQVVITNGRIDWAVIAKCQTRYTCSIIEHLQKQVSQRQSPEVDYVAAATESANAFYGAIVEALKAAKQ